MNRKKFSVDLIWQENPAFLYPAANYELPKVTLPTTTPVYAWLSLGVVKPCTLKAIVVSETVYWATDFPGQGFKSGDLLTQNANVLLSDTTYEPGQYLLPLNFDYPCDAPPEFKISSKPWGGAGIRQQCVVRVVDDKNVSHMFDIVKRVTKFPFVKEQMPKRHILPNVAEIGELPPALNLVLEGFMPLLGAYHFGIYAASLTVGCLSRLELKLPEPASDLLSITCAILETGTWQSPVDSAVQQSPQHKTTFFRTDGRHGAAMCKASNLPYSYQATFRMPHDEQIVYSTPLTTKSPLKASHRIVVSLTVLTTAGREQTISFERDIFFATCLAFSDSLLLPEYQSIKQSVPNKQDYQPLRLTDPWPCVCGFSQKQLEDRATFDQAAPPLPALKEAGPAIPS